MSYPVTSGAYDESYNGGTDTFLTRLDGDLTRVEASTYIGGSGFDNTATIIVDEDGGVVIGGHTGSHNFPVTSEAFSTAYGGGSRDVFLSSFNLDLDELLASTLLGGGGSDIQPLTVAGVEGDLYVSGSTGSSSFPVTAGAFDETRDGEGDYFLSRLEAGLSSLLYSTFIGGSGDERFGQIALTNEGDLVVAGSTGSRDFPATVGARDESYNGGDMDVFVMKMRAAQLVGGEETSIERDDGNGRLIPGFPLLSVVFGILLGGILVFHHQIQTRGHPGRRAWVQTLPQVIGIAFQRSSTYFLYKMNALKVVSVLNSVFI